MLCQQTRNAPLLLQARHPIALVQVSVPGLSVLAHVASAQALGGQLSALLTDPLVTKARTRNPQLLPEKGPSSDSCNSARGAAPMHVCEAHNRAESQDTRRVSGVSVERAMLWLGSILYHLRFASHYP